ncbi:MAG: hypothetical protein AAFP92_31915 [Bacteroidota bacterium]
MPVNEPNQRQASGKQHGPARSQCYGTSNRFQPGKTPHRQSAGERTPTSGKPLASNTDRLEARAAEPRTTVTLASSRENLLTGNLPVNEHQPAASLWQATPTGSKPAIRILNRLPASVTDTAAAQIWLGNSPCLFLLKEANAPHGIRKDSVRHFSGKAQTRVLSARSREFFH